MKTGKLKQVDITFYFELFFTIIFVICLYNFILVPVRVVENSMGSTVSGNQRMVGLSKKSRQISLAGFWWET
jgi:hypothetical protein